MAQSVWRDETYKYKEAYVMPHFETLHGDAATDVLIIGGGLCGVLCAYLLQQEGVDCLLLEGKTIGSGTTENTTAKITAQHGLIYDKLIRKKGQERAMQYLAANQRALAKYGEMAKEIACDFEEKDAYVYSLHNREILEQEVRAVNLLGFSANFAETPSLPFKTAGAVRFPGQAQFHPLKFMAGIAGGLNIREHTFVWDVDILKRRAFADTGTVKADKILVTTHFPFINRYGKYFLKMYQHRSYVIAMENAADVDGMYLDADHKGFSFRNYGDLLFVGGGSHRTGKKGGGWKELRTFAARCYPECREVYHWAAQDGMSLDGIPYIGEYSKNTPGLYVASGFNKWGMTGSMTAAMILCDMALGRKNMWQEVFSPERSMAKTQLLINGVGAAVNLLTPTAPRCPHMGCALKWNRLEHTWDCPCHGSRFEENGELIDNPAKKGMKKSGSQVSS